ncbi:MULTISPECIES: carbohydrate ABC transporter permease [unclassified Paenibacillus]|uniref:carbohydrate ABC transporter permease n=1 Tax=unclassified Paenibacillus TaxID=185978 RepID=UPI002780F84F|nr:MULTISPECIES: sugar ABC transporter permease [unclassified Paenibacillus]MDQ0901178.1 ABC-type sugar transport system permease subunit [Paenibacillus sp. V4I7]MDQ0920344.1 ABC-type sugar transport system permease subunit [Paenibacillus sp. V4I5]
MKAIVQKKNLKALIIGYLFILPSIIGFSVFVAYPLITSFYYALTEWDGFNKPKYVGIDNYIYMFTVDPAFWTSIKVTFYFVFLSVPASLALGLLLAMLLNKNLPGIKYFRTFYYLPTVLPIIASLTLWKFIYQPQYGLANQVLNLLGLPQGTWLTDENTALISVIINGLWQVGGTMIIFLSGLQSVPQDFYEAAQVDGATRWMSFIQITIPMITPILFLQLILGIIGAFQGFTQVLVLTNGGPNFSTMLLNFKIFQDAFNGKMFGYAISEVSILFAIIMLFTLVTYKFSNRFVYYENDNR